MSVKLHSEALEKAVCLCCKSFPWACWIKDGTRTQSATKGLLFDALAEKKKETH